MDCTDNVIDFARYCSRRQACRLGGVMWVVYAQRAGYAMPQPSTRHDERSHRA